MVYIFSYALAFITVVILSVFIDKTERVLPKFNFKTYMPTIVGVTMIEIGLVVYYLALSKGLASLVTPISSIYVAITVVLAHIFLTEKITKIQILGVLFSVAGIILIGI